MDQIPFELFYEIFSLLDGQFVIIFGNINSDFRDLVNNNWILQRSIIANSKLTIEMVRELCIDPFIDMTPILLSRTDSCYHTSDKVFWWCI